MQKCKTFCRIYSHYSFYSLLITLLIVLFIGKNFGYYNKKAINHFFKIFNTFRNYIRLIMIKFIKNISKSIIFLGKNIIYFNI